MPFYFQCTENRKAPPMVVPTEWEAIEMRKHPSYEEVTAEGAVLGRPDESIRTSIPFTPGNTEPTEPRAKLKLPNKKVI